MWNPESGRSPNRPFVWGTQALFDWYHREWHDIDQRWPLAVGEDADAVALLRESARNELREQVKVAVAMGFGGRCLIPV